MLRSSLLLLTTVLSLALSSSTAQVEGTLSSLCRARGESCASKADCCAGTCVEGFCRRCAKREQACVSDEECCGKKVCSVTGRCVRPKLADVAAMEPAMPEGPAPEPVNSWPAAVGMTGEEARDFILTGSPSLNVEIVHVDSFVTMDWSETRVRIRVDDNGIVVEIPMIG